MTAAMELLHPASCLLLLLLFLLTRPRVTSADNNGAVKVKVKEGYDVVLPCSLRKTDLTYLLFDWTKVKDVEDKTQNVFLYDAGKHYNNGHKDQDPQFKGRVSHFEDELQHGNASIKIRNTQLKDRGNYRCIFPRLGNQMFYIELVIGAVPEPSLTTIEHTADRALLQCSVKGAFPKPTVEWKNSAGEVLPSVVTHESKVNKHFDITLQTNVTQTGHYSCVVTQYDIGHQVYSETFVRLGAALKPFVSTLAQTKDQALLQCEVHGASSNPVVQWQDSSGNVVPAKEPQVTERGGSYDIILQTTVTKTDRYRCVSTQDEIKHQVHADIHVYISGNNTGFIAGLTAVIVVLAILLFAVLGYVVYTKCCKKEERKEGYDAPLEQKP